jgi:hypothetical protein
MKVQSIDFNQTLVFSVFGHLMILTMVLFLPKPNLPEKPVLPAFMVSLVSVPSGNQSPKKLEPKKKVVKPKIGKKNFEKKPTPKKKESKKPAIKKRKVSKSIKSKKIPSVKKHNKVLDALNKLETKVATALPGSKSMVEELDQLARLDKVQRKKQPVKLLKKKSVIEKTFRELEALKNTKIKKEKASIQVPNHEELDKVNGLKMEEDLVNVDFEKQQVLKNFKAPKKDLLKELDKLAKLDVSHKLITKKVKQSLKPEWNADGSDEIYNSILDKFDSLAVDSAPIRMEVSSTKLDSSSFQSKLRNLPDPAIIESKGESYVVSDKEGAPGADLQSLYVGMIQKKIYKNWKEPLAEEHNQETIVSFYIFSGGNIDKPFVKQSSKVDALDTLAVRAILDSVPFPEFPKELKLSNLHVNIYFKYVPKDK